MTETRGMAAQPGGQQPGEPRRRVTSSDVARAAGVSRTTVSYVLNNVEGRRIPAETRELVIRTAESLGHIPFAPARSLRLGRSNIVLVLVRDYTLGWVGSELLRRLDIALAERDQVVLLDRYDPELRPTPKLWQLVSPALVVGMSGLSLSEQSTLELESERFLRLQGTFPNERIGEMQIEYLNRKGHRRIGYAQDVNRAANLIGAERLQGSRHACADLSLPDLEPVIVDPDRLKTVDAALDGWLAKGVSAVALPTDEIALLVCARLTARGLVPGVDLAVIGVDDIPAARADLTTVAIDVEAWATGVIASVTALLDDRVPPPIASDIVRLVERASA